MPNIKVLSAREVIAVLGIFGFFEVSQKGSHIKLRRVTHTQDRETLIIPAHKELDRGTLRAIYRQACRYIPEDELRTHFFTDAG